MWRILDRLDDSYEIADGWCASPSVQAARAGTEARLQELANPYGVVPLENLGYLNPHLSHSGNAALLSWLHYCDYVLRDEFVLLRTQSLGDRAAAILSIVGAPLSAEKILAQATAPWRAVVSAKHRLTIRSTHQRQTDPVEARGSQPVL